MNAIGNIQNAFFEAMRRGYATNNLERIKVVELPGSKLVKIVAGLYLVTDCWHTNEGSGKSFGTTIISESNNPIWMMHYWGQYEKSVIPFLKQALWSEYKLGLSYDRESTRPFMGCRGPRTFETASCMLLYVNVPNEGSDFSSFNGQEQIILTTDGSVQGWHKYHGLLLT